MQLLTLSVAFCQLCYLKIKVKCKLTKRNTWFTS